jgi:hypothetical protein
LPVSFFNARPTVHVLKCFRLPATGAATVIDGLIPTVLEAQQITPKPFAKYNVRVEQDRAKNETAQEA